MKGKFVLFYLGLLIFSVGCVSETYFERYIDNRSADTLMITFSPNDAALFGMDSLIMMPKTLKQVYANIESGKVKSHECVPFEQGFSVRASSGATLEKDGTQSDDWEALYNRPANTWQCYFQIWPDDLVQ